jgi:hypothetical protein
MNKQNHTIEPEELMAYLDGELSPERATQAAAHLEQCKECRSLADEFREVSKGLLVWNVEQGNSAIPAAVAEALSERKQKRSSAAKAVTPIQVTWTWLKNPKALRTAWQLAGVGVLAAVVATISISNPLRSTGPMGMAKTSAEGEESRNVSRNPTRAEFSNGSHDGNVNATLIAPPPPPPRKAPAPLIANQELVRDQTSESEPTNQDATSSGPMIARTAQLTVTIKEFDLARKSVDEILKRHHGYIGDLTVNTPNGAARSINANLRIPSAQLDSALTALKALGRVEAEAQNGEEVTQQYVDLNARLSNARKTQQRLIEIQRDRTGKLSDVLSVELQISRVQGEIEQMEAQLKTMKNQVSFASLDLTITEQYKAELKVVPPSLGDQLRNAGIDGIRSIRDAVISVLFWLLSTGPILLFWTLILFYPARIVWKKLRPRFVPSV